MLQPRYCNEIESLLIQFISAFDDNKIYRIDNETKETKIVLPRWVLGNKSRVFYDIINQAGNITLPAAVVEPKSISFDKSRLFNKQLWQAVNTNGNTYKYKQPTPIDIKVNVNFYSKYFTEIWQMMSNFASVCNPYIFISWRVPQELLNDAQFTEEIRSEVTWDGNFDLNYQTELGENKLWIIQGSASFTIKAWLFNQPAQNEGIIYSAQSYLHQSASAILYENENGDIDYVHKDGWPSITNVIEDNIRLRPNSTFTLPVKDGKKIVVEGRSFFSSQCTGILIRPIEPLKPEISDLIKVTIDTVKRGNITGYAIIDDMEITSENIIKYVTPKLPQGLIYDIIVYNNAGYTSYYESKGFYLQAS